MKTLYALVLILISYSFSFAQQDAQYTQYMYNTVSINPAYAGSRGALSITGLHRSQWLGLEGAPSTQSFSAHTPFENSRIGLGVSLINDELGPFKEQYFNIDFSYTIPVSVNGKLSFGIKVVANTLALDINKLTPETSSSIDSNLNSFSEFQPNFGLGAYYHTDKFYLGLSVPNILETKHFESSNTLINVGKERMNYYLLGGYVFDLSANLKLKPAFLTKYVEGAPLQVDLSANAIFKDKLIFGAAYRWSAAASLMAGFQINDSFMIGYAYDLETTQLRTFNNGSHEIILRFELFNHKENIISPRFF